MVFLKNFKTNFSKSKNYPASNARGLFSTLMLRYDKLERFSHLDFTNISTYGSLPQRPTTQLVSFPHQEKLN
jgi:hypothetical protein